MLSSPVRSSSVQVTGLSPDDNTDHAKGRARHRGPVTGDASAEERGGTPLTSSGRSPSGVFFLNLDDRYGGYADEAHQGEQAQTWWCPRCRCPVVEEYDEHQGITFRACPSCQRLEHVGSDYVPGEFHSDHDADFEDDMEADDPRANYDDIGDDYVSMSRRHMSDPDHLDPRHQGAYSHDVRECPFCHDLVELSHFHVHVETCEENVRQCPFCTEDVQAFGFHEHVARCAHGVRTACPFCRRTMQAQALHEHVPRCPMNMRRCPFCNEEVRSELFHAHVQQCQQRSQEANFEFDDLGGACGDHEEYDMHEHPQDEFAGDVGERDGSFGSEEDIFSDQDSSGSWEDERRMKGDPDTPDEFAGSWEDEATGFHNAHQPPEGDWAEDGQRFDGRGGDTGGLPEDETVASACPAAAAVIVQIRQDLRGLEPAALKSKMRRLQLKWHPDKAKGDPAVVHDVFCFVQAEWERNFG